MTTKLTHSEKADLLKESIVFFYSKEGRSLAYISRALKIHRDVVSRKVKEWNVKKHEGIKPSDRKFINKNKAMIVSRFDSDNTLKSIAEELRVTVGFLSRVLSLDEELSKSFDDNKSRRGISKIGERTFSMNYDPESEDGEVWRSIMGYKNYQVSSHGRVKSLFDSKERIVVPQPNKNNQRLYVGVHSNGERRNLQVARVVANTFITIDTPEDKTVNHKDGDVQNNHVDNLEWVTQSSNNQHAYDKLGRKAAIAYSKTGRFKKIVLDDKYEFKTIRAFAKFINKSETQASRYIHGKVQNNPYKIDIVY